MKDRKYSRLGSLDVSTDAEDASQLSFLMCDNFVNNRKLHVLMKRGGSEYYTLGGDIWGLFGYTTNASSAYLPAYTTVIRHRRDLTVSYFERYDWDEKTFNILPQGEYTSFNIGNLTSSAQIDALCAIAAGRPAKLMSATGEITRLGGDEPFDSPDYVVVSAGTLTAGSYSYCYTFYDSTTGWESSPSPVTDLIEVDGTESITLTNLATDANREGVDKKRIYRTIHTGEAPYLMVAEIDLATTPYPEDNLDDADLGATAPDAGDHDAPPAEAYIVYAHEGRLWIASGSALYYSHPYSGNYYDLEYFSENRKIVYSHTITGLASFKSGGLFVFTPPRFGIHEIVGRTASEFESVPRYPQSGTNFHTSITVEGDYLFYWDDNGPALITTSGEVRSFDKPIKNLLRDALSAEYNINVFVWSAWNSALNQIIFGYSSTSGTGAMWSESGTSIVVPWMDPSTGKVVDWEVTSGQDEPVDTTAPIITNVQVTNIQTTSVVITWTTNEAATGQVEYGETDAYGSETTKNTNLITNHSETVSGLSSGTLYHFKVVSEDAATNEAESADFTFTTLTTGATLWVFEDFSSGVQDAYWSSLQTEALHYTPNTSEIVFVTTPKRVSTHALHYYALAGTDEKIPAQLNKNFSPSVAEFYLEWYEYFVTGYPFAASSQKMVRFGHWAEGEPEHEKQFNLWCQWNNIELGISWHHVDQGIDQGRWPGFGISKFDDWIKFGIWVKLNTYSPQLSDGFIKVWMDDVLIHNHIDINIRGSDSEGYNFMWLGGNYSNIGVGLPNSGHRYIDEIRMYNTKPGG